MPTETEKGRSTASEANAPAVLPPADDAPRAIMTVAALADIPEEDIWLAKQKSKRTRRAYKQDVQNFMRTLNIHSYDELRPRTSVVVRSFNSTRFPALPILEMRICRSRRGSPLDRFASEWKSCV